MLNLSEKIKTDLKGSSYTVYPFVIIDASGSPLYISTFKEVITYPTSEAVYFEDYNLKVSSITESIDTETHSFRISNVNLSFNNYSIDCVRISDILSEKINKQVLIYYKTQSINTLQDSMSVYRGYIKRISHSSDSVDLTLENSSDIEFDKEVPVANLGFSSNTYNKDYINRPIPFTYGIVDKAPVIPWVDTTADTGRTNMSIIPDDIGDVTGSDRGIFIKGIENNSNIPELNFEQGINKQSYLHIYKDDYFRVLQEYNSSVGQESSDNLRYNLSNQYSIDASKQFITIEKSYSGLFPNNPPAINQFQTVKIQRPTQTELLISEDGVAEEGNVGSVINITPLTGILRPEAAVDSEENPTMMLDYDNTTEFDTFAQIPNNQITEQNALIDDGDLVASLFVNSNQSTGFNGIYHPNERHAQYLMSKTNYLWSMCSWMQLNAHHCNIEFINIPSGNMIITVAWERMLQGDYAADGGGFFFECKLSSDESKKAEIFHQYAASEGFKNAWINACEGIDGYENTNGHEYFNVSPVLNPFRQGQGFDVEGSPINNSYIFANPDKKPFYPQTIFKIRCNVDHSNNLKGIKNVYVGQWDETTMAGALDDNEIFIDLVEREGQPANYYQPYSWWRALFKQEKLATFKPFQLKQKTPIDYTNTDYSNVSAFKTQYGAKYNGVPVGTINGTPFNEGSSRIKDNYFAGGYGFLEEFSIFNMDVQRHRISMNSLCNHSSSQNAGNTGGQSWWMLVKEDIPRDRLFKNLSSAGIESQGDYNDPSCNTMVRAGTLIPCNSRFDYNITGTNFSYDFVYNISTEKFLISSGNNNSSPTPEQRLSVLFPMANLKTRDFSEESTHTFVYGDVKLNIPNNDENLHDTSDKDDILLQAYATNLILDESIDYNAEFTGDSNLYATNLIKLQGNDSIFTDGGEISWSVRDFLDEDDDGNLFNELNKYKISDWANPNSFTALSLAYRIRNTEQLSGSMVQLSTNIHSIGLLQYTVYENVFNSDLYADVKGRRDNDSAYYSNHNSSVIENPASVMFHFADKELGAKGASNIEKINEAMGETSGFRLAFSIQDETNGKSLLSDISKSTKLYPRFDSQGRFSYAFIPEQPTASINISNSDIVNFRIDRTKIEDVKTMVNVKYKKDYASNKYTKETGYCDGYDFFGNGEEGKEVYKNVNGENQWIKRGYDYSYLNIKREDNILEFKSDYIRDSHSATELRNFLYLQNCNQHTIIECTLSMKYLHLEVGDVLQFEDIINNTKAFGEDYSINSGEFYYRNAQKIFTKFIITQSIKSSKNIKIKCMQLHGLKGDFNAGKGSITRRSVLGVSAYLDENMTYANEHITFEDIDLIEDIISGTNGLLTKGQKISADISNEGAITQYDLTILQTLMNDSSLTLGDINIDGVVNVADILAIASYILDDGSYSQGSLGLYAADINQDGLVNIADIVEITKLVLEGSE